MVNTLYDKGREAFLSGGINWGVGTAGDPIKATLVDVPTYAFSNAHQFLSDIPAPARVATSPAFVNKTVLTGIADADNITFVAVTGVQSEALVIFKDTGTATTSPLIAYIDTATGLPVTPNGGDITVTWDNGVNKIFKL